MSEVGDFFVNVICTSVSPYKISLLYSPCPFLFKALLCPPSKNIRRPDRSFCTWVYILKCRSRAHCQKGVRVWTYIFKNYRSSSRHLCISCCFWILRRHNYSSHAFTLSPQWDICLDRYLCLNTDKVLPVFSNSVFTILYSLQKKISCPLDRSVMRRYIWGDVI